MKSLRQKPRLRVMPIEQFECSVFSIVRKKSGWDGVYPQAARNAGVHALHKTNIREAYDNAKSMVFVAGGIIADLRQYGATFNSPGGSAC